jgi:hypothetical protein
MGDAMFLAVIFGMVVLCSGDPDIIDGWRAAANAPKAAQTNCK